MPSFIQRALAFLQTIATADKTAIVAAGVDAVTLLAARFGFQLNASVTAYVAVLISAAVSAFTHVHFARKAAAAKAPKLELHQHFEGSTFPAEVGEAFKATIGNAPKAP